jgi:hypothetical protein
LSEIRRFPRFTKSDLAGGGKESGKGLALKYPQARRLSSTA